MSSQRGNVKKGPQKHKNKTAFKNDLHDKRKVIQQSNDLDVTGCCQRCKEIIEWKIKYKKYKPLTVAKKCTKCLQKTVKRAYYIVCDKCISEKKVCGKCSQPKELVGEPGLSANEEAAQRSRLEQEVKMLSERQRRTFFRLQESGKLSEATSQLSVEGQGDDHEVDFDPSSEEEEEISSNEELTGE